MAEREALLDRRLAEAEAKAAADALQDVRIEGCEATISPLKAVTPEEAAEVAERLHGTVPNARVAGVRRRESSARSSIPAGRRRSTPGMTSRFAAP